MSSVPIVGLERLTAALLEAVGLDGDRAALSAHAMVLADRWGISSHGVMRLPWYLDRLKAGGINPDAELRTHARDRATVAFDGEAGLGHWQVWQAAEIASSLATAFGIGAVAVGNSNHCGSLGVYTLPMLEQGRIGLIFSHGPAVMPPWNGRIPVLSTSPLAAGIPCRPHPAIVDLSTSAVARGRVAEHAKRGDRLPAGWALDEAGQPTTDPTAALEGMLAPLGGHKGFALAFLVEALTAAMVGPRLSVGVTDLFDAALLGDPQGISHLALALDPSKFDTDGTAPRRLSQLAEAIERAGGRLPGANRKLTPFTDQERVHVEDAVLQELRERALRLGVPN